MRMEAKSAGVGYRMQRLPMAGVLRAGATSRHVGLLRHCSPQHSDCMLGFTRSARKPGELIAVVPREVAESAYTVLRDAILTHRLWRKDLRAVPGRESRKRRQRRPQERRRRVDIAGGLLDPAIAAHHPAPILAGLLGTRATYGGMPRKAFKKL